MLEIYKQIIEYCGFWGAMLIIATLVLFIIQLCYYMGRYARVTKYRNTERKDIRGEEDAISVVVLVSDNKWYIDNMLPKLMLQDYPAFEIVIVDIGSLEEFSDYLNAEKLRYPNLVVTSIPQDPRFPISNKLAYNVGIKASSYENIVLTTADAIPVSDKWLRCMGKGFASGDVVIAYSGIEHKEGFVNKMIRSSRLMLSVNFLSASIIGKPYRGIIHNLGFRRQLYFESRGFTNLDMNIGEDDLFIQHIATKENTSIVMNPNATVQQGQWGELKWWWRQRRFFTSTYKFYPLWAKNILHLELIYRFLFYAAIVALIVIMPFYVKIAAIVLWLLRAFLVRFELWRIRRRLNEPKLGWALMLHDIILPFYELALAISRKIRRPAGVWR